MALSPRALGTGAIIRKHLLLSVLLLASLGGCQRALSPDIIKGAAAYQTFPPADPAAPLAPYRIGPFDTLDIRVFQEPDLSVQAARVDAGGALSLPLIGSVEAYGRTTDELSREIARRLRERYLEDPQVSVLVANAVSQRVTVDGSVNQAGVFPIQSRATLLEALALAGGTSRTAALDQVIVFRMIDGRQNAAVFNVDEIRRGIQPNPVIYGNDTITVGFSNIKSAWRDIISAAPFVTVFRPLL